MTTTRCPTCDRETCEQPRYATMNYEEFDHVVGFPAGGEGPEFDRYYASRNECKANRVNWRERALAAEQSTTNNIANWLESLNNRPNLPPLIVTLVAMLVAMIRDGDWSTTCNDSERVCSGEYDDGIADGNTTTCQLVAGCGLRGCPSYKKLGI